MDLYKGLLFFGPPPKAKTWPELRAQHGVFVNLREKTDTSHWYFPEVEEKKKTEPKRNKNMPCKWINVTKSMHIPDEYDDHLYKEIRFIGYPIPVQEGIGRQVDLNDICGELVQHIIKKKQSVYIHDGSDAGEALCGPLVLGCLYWLKKVQDNETIDPIKYVRDKLVFILCKPKEQRHQLDAIKSYADRMAQWGSWGVATKKRKKSDKP